jgi:pimeloyl-ACP methyl ester carboxylesterase
MTKVLVNGNPEVDAIWRPLIAALGELGTTDVVCLSPPGFGAEVPDGFEPSMAAYAEWLVTELDTLHADHGPLDLVGHDWGAGHVFGALTLRPDLVRSWATDVVGLLHPDYEWHAAAQGWQAPDVGEQIIDALVSMTTADRATAFAGLGLPDDILAEVATGVTADMGRCILGLYRDAAQPAMAALGRRVAGCQLPRGLGIVATADAYVPQQYGDAIIDQLGADRLVLDGLGHWWMVEDPAGATRGLIDFWEGSD